MNAQNTLWTRLGNLSGIVAPLLWAGAIVFCASLRPDFNHYTQYISELSERGSSTENLFRYTGFVPTGILHMLFGVFLMSTFRGSRLAALGALLFVINGIARIGAGLFSCEPGCVSPNLLLNQQMHRLSATVAFLAIILATLIWGLVFRKIQGLRSLSLFSFSCGVSGLAFLLLMEASSQTRAGTGLYERLSSGSLSLWVLVFATRLWWLNARGQLNLGYNKRSES
jgi:hypothetical membrane protein